MVSLGTTIGALQLLVYDSSGFLWLKVLLGAAFLEEAKVDPENEACGDDHGPWNPDVSRCRGKVQIASTISVLVSEENF